MLKKIIFIYLFTHLLNFAFSQVSEYKKEDTLQVNHWNTIGRDSIIAGSYVKADSLISLALELAEKINFSSGLFNAYTNKGVVLWYRDNYPKALDNQFKALKVAEQMNSKLFKSRALANIGLIYASKSEHEKALKYYKQSLKIKEEIGDKKAVAILLGNMAKIFSKIKDYNQALDFYYKSLIVLKEVKNNSGLVALNYSEIGYLLQEQGDLLKSKEYYSNALRLADSIDDKLLVSATLVKIGNLNIVQKKYRDAETNLQQAFDIASDIGSMTTKKDVYFALSDLFEKTNNWNLSLKNYKNYINLQDSVFSQDNTKKMVQLEMNYEFSKKEEAAELEQEKKEAISQAESKKQQIIIWSICAILVLALIFTFYVFKSFKEKQKVNVEITKQKHIIEEKQKEILDSIYYARRIQRALLTPEKYIERNLNKLAKKL